MIEIGTRKHVQEIEVPGNVLKHGFEVFTSRRGSFLLF